ncbi:MAG: type I phosphomannose isomerase catalytic subunit [Thermomicrobiales bacterium]
MTAWYPLKMTFHIRDYAFGERLIPGMLGKTGVPPSGRVSETWEISDHRETSGVVTNGGFAGKTLHEVTMAHPEALVGQGWHGPHFPMLGKFLDASHRLPVHLHADDETAARLHGAPNGKTEAWHILWAAPGASVLAGIEPGKTREDLVAAFKAQDYDSVMPRHPIAAGDTVYVPGCILHSFGPDTLIFEIQQTSDLGQSVMPEDLYGNRLSPEQWDAGIDATLAELKTTALPRPTPGLPVDRGHGANAYRVGAAGPYFALERWTLREPHRQTSPLPGCLLVSNVGEPVGIDFPGGTVMLGRAESCIIPAAMEAFTIAPTTYGDLIVCHLPDIAGSLLPALRTAGHGDEEIGRLGDMGV